MKICPKCGKTYTDESLNFCLDDGSVLSQANSGFNKPLPETVLINQPRPTAGNQPFGNHTENQNWGNVPVVQTKPKKGSKTWLLVVGILGTVVVLCGGGLIGLVAFGNMNDDDPNWNANFGKNKVVSNTNRTDTSTTTSTDEDSGITKVDMSNWVRENSLYGKTAYQGNELKVSAIKNNFYYVLVAPAVYISRNAITKISMSDVESGNNTLGYGLIINSNPTPLITDYAFLINTKTKKYRIVSHTPGKEKTIVNWKSSDSIKTGSQENVLEVQDKDGKFNFYINGELLETLSSSDSYNDGVAGIYVGGTSPVAFSNLEIRK